MKGNISLKSFIEEVKEELKDSINNTDPFFIMGDVELEVSFALDAEAKAGAKLFVIDIGGSTKASQTHKVKLTLTPFVEPEVEPDPKPKGNNRGKTRNSMKTKETFFDVRRGAKSPMRRAQERTRPTAQAPIYYPDSTPTRKIIKPTVSSGKGAGSIKRTNGKNDEQS